MPLSHLFRWPPFAHSSNSPMDEATKLVIEWYQNDHNKSFIRLLAFTTFMTIWPWIFFGVVMGFGGVAMPLAAASIANRHPQDVSFFVTSLSNLLTFVIGYLFSAAVSRLSQKYVVHKDPNIAHISFLTHLKNRSFPKSLLEQHRVRPVLTVLLYMVIFNFVTSGISALLTPVVFNRHEQLQATELDFGATDPACIEWFNNNTIPHICDWTVTFMSRSTTIKTDLCVCSYIGVQGCKLYNLPRRKSAGRRVGCCPWQCPSLFTYFTGLFSDSPFDRFYHSFPITPSA